MKIAISSSGPGLDSAVDARFGRATGFVVVDTDTGKNTYASNDQNLSLAQGAGIQAAQAVAETGANVLLTGHVGPKAFLALDKGGIAIHLGITGTVQDALDSYESGALAVASGPDKDGHW